MSLKSTPAAIPDEFGLLSSIWILSCNDQIPYMTYEGIKYRLGLPADYDVRKLIGGHGELFRAKVPASSLNEWKDEMLAGDRVPSWIREEADSSERKTLIQGLSPDDLFRNQFRTEANAPRAELEVIKWGLDHIENLRSAQVDLREARVKRWTNMRIPILSTLLALVALMSSAFLQWVNIVQQKQTLDVQKQLKYYEVELKPKLDGYSSLMNAMLESLRDADLGDVKATSTTLDRARVAFYAVEPFLFKPEREPLLIQLGTYSMECRDLADKEDLLKRRLSSNKYDKVEIDRLESKKDEVKGHMLSAFFDLQDKLLKKLFPE